MRSFFLRHLWSDGAAKTGYLNKLHPNPTRPSPFAGAVVLPFKSLTQEHSLPESFVKDSTYLLNRINVHSLIVARVIWSPRCYGADVRGRTFLFAAITKRRPFRRIRSLLWRDSSFLQRVQSPGCSNVSGKHTVWLACTGKNSQSWWRTCHDATPLLMPCAVLK